MSDSPAHAGFQAPDPAELNKLFPGYEIESLIATGGMGAVYCAVQKSLDRIVALKILPQEFSKDAAFCEGFEAEAKAMARLNHPNLIGVYDFGEAGGMLYIIMEFVKGKSIYHSAHGRAIDSREVIRLVSAVCDGLAHAHENGIIHRDIKPSNILLDLNAQPKIGDFGLARPIERKIQEGEEIFGTPHYTAPEVVNAPHSVDYRADIFSVGVMLHELLTGKLPADDPRPPSAIVHCDRRFDVIVRRATHNNPAGRYSSAAEMAKDLAVIANSAAKSVVRAPAPGGRGHAGPRVAAPLQPRRVVKAKNSSGFPAFILLLAVVTIGAGVYFYRSSLVPPEKPMPAGPSNSGPVSAIIPEVSSSTGDLSEEPDPDLDRPSDLKVAPKPRPIVVEEPEEPAPEPIAKQPKFDVPGFFERARNIMRGKAKPAITSRDSNLRENFSEFGVKLERQVRKLESGRIQVMGALEENLKSWAEDGSQIPVEVDYDLSDIPDVDEIFEEFLGFQNKIEDSFQQALSVHSATYILGLEKQIERLQTENDPAAIALIKQEIELTKKQKGYFVALMLGLDPDVMDSSDDDE
ncbi:MAG: serine/threonine-protein kinase [Akkermansiaceae bacterium]